MNRLLRWLLGDPPEPYGLYVMDVPPPVAMPNPDGVPPDYWEATS